MLTRSAVSNEKWPVTPGTHGFKDAVDGPVTPDGLLEQNGKQSSGPVSSYRFLYTRCNTYLFPLRSSQRMYTWPAATDTIAANFRHNAILLFSTRRRKITPCALSIFEKRVVQSRNDRTQRQKIKIQTKTDTFY